MSWVLLSIKLNYSPNLRSTCLEGIRYYKVYYMYKVMNLVFSVFKRFYSSRNQLNFLTLPVVSEVEFL